MNKDPVPSSSQSAQSAPAAETVAKTEKGLLQIARENPYVLTTCLFSSLGGLLFGYDQGVISGIITMESFGAKFPRIYSDSNFRGWFVSTYLLSAWFGSLINSPIAERYSRRTSIVVACIIFVIGSTFQCAGISISMLFGGRAVAGLAIGMLTMVVPLYMAEISPSEIRGGLVVLQQLNITFGILISFWIDYGTNYIGGTRCDPSTPYTDGDSFDPYLDAPNGCTGQSSASWRLPFALQIVPALILGLGMKFFPFTPRWLLTQDRNDEALAVLARLRRKDITHSDIQDEFLKIKAEVIFEQTLLEDKYPGKRGLKLHFAQYASLVSSWPTFKRVFIGSAVMFFQQFMGCNALIYYAPSIFANLGFSSNTTSLLATGVYGIVNFFSTFPALLLIDRLGRRTLLMSGAIGTFIALVVVGAIIGKYGDALSEHHSAGWTGVAFIYIYCINFAYSWAPIGWVIPSEIFSLGIRSKAISITTSSTWMCNFIIGLVTPMMLDTLTWGTYIFFAVFCLLAFLFTLFIIPETRQRSLEDMDAVFGDDSAQRDKQRLAQINARLGLEPYDEELSGKQNYEMQENV
ncbi:general substrate transporter [Dipodascopsis tothii]|uniref:general substrate transporter n=1 Tax=Dipodascopsis tothii TaxID=44089 RepID=UPI0034CFA125